jgi:hypothetical protein
LTDADGDGTVVSRMVGSHFGGRLANANEALPPQ